MATVLLARIAELDQEVQECNERTDRMASILSKTANALHGGPLETGLWSWHDLPELATKQRAALENLRRLISSLAKGGISYGVLYDILNEPLATGCCKCGDWGKVYDDKGQLEAACPAGCPVPPL